MNLFNTDRFLDGCWQISTALSAAKMRMSPTNVGIGRVKRQSIEPVLAARKIELICLIMPHGMESKSTNRCTKHHGGNCQPPSSTRFHHSPRVIPPHTQLWGYHHFQKVLFLWFSGVFDQQTSKVFDRVHVQPQIDWIWITSIHIGNHSRCLIFLQMNLDLISKIECFIILLIELP